MTAQPDAATTREQAATAWRNVSIRQALIHIQHGDKAAAVETMILSVQAQQWLLGLGADE